MLTPSRRAVRTLTLMAAMSLRWGLWGPLDFLSSMAIEAAGFSPSLGPYLISIIKYVPPPRIPSCAPKH